MVRSRFVLPLLAAILPLLTACGARAASGASDPGIFAALPTAGATTGTSTGSLVSGGETRTYVLHVPPRANSGTAMPLVIVLHGAGGQGAGMAGLTGMNAVADRNGFVAVYPDGLDRYWRDGRGRRPGFGGRANVDDVGFIADLIDALARQLPIDRARVYATGMSNGAIFAHRLGCELTGQLAAIATVAGSMGEPTAQACQPARPLPVLLIQGEDDPFVPWSGGVVLGLGAGPVRSTPDTALFWAKADGCSTTPTVAQLPDTDPQDGTTTRHESYGGCRAGADVDLYAIADGGHTWPGGLQYLPEKTIGKTSRDWNASETIWAFFAAHPHP